MELAGIALTRHSIEQVLEEAKSQTGLADYEVRHWHGWHRHITLALLAHTFLKLIQHQQREKNPLPIWFSLSVAELRCLFNIVLPLPRPTKAFRLHWFWWRREHRFRTVAARFQINYARLLRLALPP